MDTPLVALTDTQIDELVLRKPSWRRGVHDLYAGEALIGRLDRSVWTGGAEAQAADGRWRFGRSRGLRQRYVAVLAEPFEQEVARFQRHRWKRGGVLELDGRRYALDARGWRRSQWRWTADGVDLARLRSTDSLGDVKARLALTDAGLRSGKAALLLLLGAHLALLSGDEAGSSSAAATSGG